MQNEILICSAKAFSVLTHIVDLLTEQGAELADLKNKLQALQTAPEPVQQPAQQQQEASAQQSKPVKPAHQDPYMTISDYLKENGIRCSYYTPGVRGMKIKTLCEYKGLPVRVKEKQNYGTVNLYPMSLIAEVVAQEQHLAQQYLKEVNQ